MNATITAYFDDKTIVIEPASCVIHYAKCNENLQHVENYCDFTIVYDEDLFSRLQTYESFAAVVHNESGGIEFTGTCDIDASWRDLGRPYPIESISLKIRDATYKLEKNTQSEIALRNTTFSACLQALCIASGVTTNLSIADFDVPVFVVTKGRQILSTLNSFCFQNGYVFYFDRQNNLCLFDFKAIPESCETLDEDDICSEPEIKKTKKKYTGVKGTYNSLKTVANSQVFFETPSYDDDNNPVPVAIQPGVYYPFEASPIIEADEGQVYQSFASGYAQSKTKYNGEIVYERTSDTTLLYTYDHQVTEDWTGSLVIERTGFESLRASVRFLNQGTSVAYLNKFAIRATAIYREADATVEIGDDSNQFTMECEFLYSSVSVQNIITILLKYFTLGNVSVTFLLDKEYLDPGQFFMIDLGLSGFNRKMLTRSVSHDCDTNLYTYEALSVSAQTGSVTKQKTQNTTTQGPKGDDGDPGPAGDPGIITITNSTTPAGTYNGQPGVLNGVLYFWSMDDMAWIPQDAEYPTEDPIIWFAMSDVIDFSDGSKLLIDNSGCGVHSTELLNVTFE